jgi:hypothetical protein
LVRCSCLLLSAGCCVVAACSGFVHHWYRLQGMSDRVNTQTSMHTYTIACCATRIGQLQLSAGCSEYCRMHRACTGFVHGNTAKYRLQGMSDRIDTREQACTSIFECSAALTVQLRLFAIYSGYCRMHRVCAACLEPRYSLQGPLYRRNTFK